MSALRAQRARNSHGTRTSYSAFRRSPYLIDTSRIFRSRGKCRCEIYGALEGRTTPHSQNLRFFILGNAARRRPNVTLIPYPSRACFISGSLPSSLSQRLLHVVGCTRLLHFSENSIFGVPASAGNTPLHNCTLPRFRANNTAFSLSLTRAPSSYTCFEWFPPQCRP